MSPCTCAALPIRVSIGWAGSRLNMFGLARRCVRARTLPSTGSVCAGCDILLARGTSTASCSGLKPAGISTSWSMFSKYRKLKGSSCSCRGERGEVERCAFPSEGAIDVNSTCRWLPIRLAGAQQRQVHDEVPVRVPAVMRTCSIFTPMRRPLGDSRGRTPAPASRAPPAPADRRSCGPLPPARARARCGWCPAPPAACAARGWISPGARSHLQLRALLGDRQAVVAGVVAAELVNDIAARTGR